MGYEPTAVYSHTYIFWKSYIKHYCKYLYQLKTMIEKRLCVIPCEKRVVFRFVVSHSWISNEFDFLSSSFDIVHMMRDGDWMVEMLPSDGNECVEPPTIDWSKTSRVRSLPSISFRDFAVTYDYIGWCVVYVDYVTYTYALYVLICNIFFLAKCVSIYAI